MLWWNGDWVVRMTVSVKPCRDARLDHNALHRRDADRRNRAGLNPTSAVGLRSHKRLNVTTTRERENRNREKNDAKAVHGVWCGLTTTVTQSPRLMLI